jgi:hypothetical protein
MKKFLILRSVTKKARKYADRHFKHFKFFDSPQAAIDELKAQPKDERPWFVIVDASVVMSMGVGSKAMGLGYIVESRGVT